MRLKTFQALNMKDALAAVRKSIGNDAVIVSSVEDETGVQVTVAMEDKKESVNTAENSISHTLEQINLVCHICDYHRIPSNLRDYWLEILSPLLLKEENAVEVSLNAFLSFKSNLLNSKDPIVFIGPPGSGKSISLAKLAYMLLRQNKNIKIISCDTLKSGALEQMLSYTKALEQPLEIVSDMQGVAELLHRINDNVTLLIDTPGINPYDQSEVSFLKELLSPIRSDFTLVLDADMDAVESVEVARRFMSLKAKSLLITKLDATRHYGSIIAAAYAGRMNLGLYGASPSLDSGLHELTPASLWQLLGKYRR